MLQQYDLPIAALFLEKRLSKLSSMVTTVGMRYGV